MAMVLVNLDALLTTIYKKPPSAHYVEGSLLQHRHLWLLRLLLAYASCKSQQCHSKLSGPFQ